MRAQDMAMKMADNIVVFNKRLFMMSVSADFVFVLFPDAFAGEYYLHRTLKYYFQL